VGDFGDNFHTNIPELRQKAAQCDVTQRVIFTGFVPDPELATLYRNARGVVLPSLWEGFGLPAAEAMASGTPVLHSTAGSLPEIVGEGGLSFDPLNITDLCNKWLLMDQDDQLRHSLAERGRKRSERYRWQEAGSLLWDEIVHLNSRTSGLSRNAG
jgi:glycosyltransferase involved in cell wall biosynthesis